jgi:hypothetical protein
MEELIQRVVSNLGIDEELAKTVIGLIFNLFKENGESGAVETLMNAMPGSADLASAAASTLSDGDSGGGGLGGMLGAAASLLGGDSPAMALVGQLTGAGLSINQAKDLGTEVMNFANEKAGADVVAKVASSIPGLDQLL